MVGAGAHLGADGSGIRHGGPVALGHCSFWCTPEEVGERQPLGDREGRYWLAADARLDNREDLLQKLQQAGAGQRLEASDAQLILAGYPVWGPDLFPMLVGDFALVLWDGPGQRLFCARDALGRRPLFYHHSPARFLCASSIRQLFCAPDTPRPLAEPTVARSLAP